MISEVGMVARILLLVGVLFLISGLFLFTLEYAGIRNWKLPGDIVYRKDNIFIYFPITSCIALSILLALISWIIASLRRYTQNQNERTDS
jgi:uncharacterized membrane protein